MEERRKALEADRQARLKEMEEKRKQRSARAEQQQLEREKERLENIRAKERSIVKVLGTWGHGKVRGQGTENL